MMAYILALYNAGLALIMTLGWGTLKLSGFCGIAPNAALRDALIDTLKCFAAIFSALALLFGILAIA